MPAGRPTKYDPSYCEQVFKLCLLGATDEDLADFFDVSVQTLHNWTEAHPEFLESRKKGKQQADAEVAYSLYHRALGYSHKAVKIMAYEGASFEHEYTEHHPPDTAACFIWLKNRAGWRDRQELTGKDGGPIETRDVTDLTDDELKARLAAVTNRLALVTPSTNGNGNGKHA